jgi:hypothetical protein
VHDLEGQKDQDKWMDAHAELALLQDLKENDSDGGEEFNHDISDDYSFDSEPQPESTLPRPSHKKASTVCPGQLQMRW